MDISKIKFGTRTCNIFLPGENQQGEMEFPVAYLLGVDSKEELEKICAESKNQNVILVAIPSAKWEKEFTPWPAEGLRKGTPFEGGAKEFLSEMKEFIKPKIDERFPIKKDSGHTAVLGYSLAGLCSVYSIFVSGFADNIGGISASLWYPSWTEFCSKNDFKNPGEKNFYLSVGNREHVTKNPLMAKVDECFKITETLLKSKYESSVFFEYNEGGHFNDCEKRLAKGIDFLCSKMI